MKKIVFLILFAMVATMGFAQEDKAVTERLKQKYPFACYHERKDDGDYYTVNAVGYNTKGKNGACDLQGNEIIPCKYDNVTKHTGYFCVKLNGKAGACDLSGKEIVPCKYDDVSAYEFEDGDYARVKLNGKTGLVDKKGNEFVAPIYDDIESYFFKHYDYVDIELNGKRGLLDRQGNIVPPKYDIVYSHYFKDNHDYALVGLNGKEGVVDKKGNEIIAPGECSHINICKEVIVLAKGGTVIGSILNTPKNAKWGLYSGEANVKFNYDYLSHPSEKLIAFNIGGKVTEVGPVKVVGGKWGYLDMKGKEVIPAQYETAENFKDGAAMVSLNGQTTLIENPLQKGKANIGGFANFAADVDVNIPETGVKNDETFVFIFANEHYSNLTVPFALNDGKIFKEYCVKTLGVPEKNNIISYEDATIGKMRSAIKRIKDIADVYNDDVRFIIYYSGQGLTDEKTKIPYLLPIDAVITNLSTTGYSLEELNRELSELPAKSVWLIIDACFNGTDKEGKMLTSTRGVAEKPKTNRADGNLILFSATSGNETAYAYKEKNHGLFTYFLLKKLQETKGEITGKALSDYVISEVKKQSVSNVNVQSPTVIVSDKLTNWQTLKLK